MEIKVNGEAKKLEGDAITVSDVLSLLEVAQPDMVSVELNGEILERGTFGDISVSEGDAVEFLYFMGGGE